ncbi:hypothetical protein BKA64DRAFT_713831 [Cadophora sp. MPI-SDFR-AT-0126]|nr:hypothetical protein BKA64DRAFT_713831 [Leotiomycetes sp. MPI-SDFR-AT-0126]
MFCYKILLSCCVVGFASAYTLPAGLHDGLYGAFLDDRGNEVHRRLPPPSLENINTNTTVLEERQTDGGGGGDQLPPQFRCGCGFIMDHGGCDASVQDLKDQLGSGVSWINANSAWYSIRSNVVSFICVGPYGANFRASSFQSATEQITYHCGSYVAGTKSMENLLGYQFLG